MTVAVAGAATGRVQPLEVVTKYVAIAQCAHGFYTDESGMQVEDVTGAAALFPVDESCTVGSLDQLAAIRSERKRAVELATFSARRLWTDLCQIKLLHKLERAHREGEDTLNVRLTLEDSTDICREIFRLIEGVKK